MGGAKHKTNTAGRRGVWARVRERETETEKVIHL